ncbi:hypothetical protein CFR79_14195 [Komagataeibacter saccharivorans]|nr:hypothetical protein CFR79_14195 [Komagataeibacter saccharivorans]
MPPLLRSPPMRRGMPSLSVSRSSCHPADLTATLAPDDEDTANLIVSGRVGGAFWGPAPHVTRPIVICDGHLPAADQKLASRLLSWALRHYPSESILLVVRHPHGSAVRIARCHGVAVTDAQVDPHALLDGAREVHCTGPHDLADLAAMRGLPVLVHRETGALPTVWTRSDACLRLIRGTRYIDPYTGKPIGCREAIAILTLWRRTILSNRQVAACAGMSLWKRRRIAEFLTTAPGSPPFIRYPSALRRIKRSRSGHDTQGVAVWATRIPQGLEAAARTAGLEIWRVEDGFIRSVGLGSGLQVPCSIFLDRRGIYYDPSRPSDLEHILATHPFDDTLRERARKLIDLVVAGGISKYGVDTDGALPERGDTPVGRRPVILVPGQVSDDMSVLLGGGTITSNMDLLRAVRARNPDAVVIYRPHPDVNAGHRAGALNDAEVRQYADQISRGGSVISLLSKVDAVHTLTSLAGFEALLRGVQVVTYGVPFYAGWGLTTDLGPVPHTRRHRSLTLEELVAGTLLLYPSYIDPLTRLPCEPEMLIDRIQDARLWRPTLLMRAREIQGRVRRRLGQMKTERVTPVAGEKQNTKRANPDA